MTVLDAIYSRYGDAQSILDGYIGSGMLCSFIDGFIDIYNENMLYDLWKLRVHDKTFAEFKEDIEEKENQSSMTDRDIEEIIRDSAVIFEKMQEVRIC